jgi:gamma-glutamyltranspeptidase/glutathione hydrolase
MRRSAPALWLVCLALSVFVRPATDARAGGCVATVHPLATDAALTALARGGNAIDAAVAAALTLGVVDGHNSGIGGGCFILLRLADGRLVAIDGREMAPGRATRDMYVRDGKPRPELAAVGPLAVAVPGAIAAHAEAVRTYGRLPLSELLRPAAALADRGFPLGRVMAGAIRHSAKQLAQFEGSRAALLHADGSPYREGETLRQPDLARTYRAIAEQGIAWFYRGPFAQQVGAWMAANGGLVTADDFARYRTRRREPLVTTYRGWTIVGFPPPSSGGLHVAQILNIVERFPLAEFYRREPAKYYHVLAEAMKAAFADRAYWLGDPDFTHVPRGLADKQYAAGLAQRIRLDRAMPVESHGAPPAADNEYFGRHTTHVAAADDQGNWVAMTCTVNLTFGSRVIVPGTGVVLNDQMDDFSVSPGVPNATGLVGAEANAIAPGKRPLSSMSPTIVLRDGRPVLTIGAAGGPKIITQVVMGLTYHLDAGLDLPAAVGGPRIHQQWRPDRLMVERVLDPAVVNALKDLGHEVTQVGSVGITQAIARGADGRTWIGVHDPRVPGKAASQ